MREPFSKQIRLLINESLLRQIDCITVKDNNTRLGTIRRLLRTAIALENRHGDTGGYNASK